MHGLRTDLIRNLAMISTHVHIAIELVINDPIPVNKKNIHLSDLIFIVRHEYINKIYLHKNIFQSNLNTNPYTTIHVSTLKTSSPKY